jgi:hypothetical protein
MAAMMAAAAAAGMNFGAGGDMPAVPGPQLLQRAMQQQQQGRQKQGQQQGPRPRMGPMHSGGSIGARAHICYAACWLGPGGVMCGPV